MRTNFTKITLSTALCTLLSACGGGGSGGSSSGSSGASVPSVIAKIQTASICGGATNPRSADLFFYDKNWQIIARKAASADGTINAETPASAAHIGFAVNNGSATAPEVDVKVLADINSGNFGTLYIGTTHDKASCDCQSFNATLSKASSSTSSTLNIASNGFNYGHSISFVNNTATLEVCRVKGANWPMLTFYSPTDAAGAELFYDQVNTITVGSPILVNLSKTATKVAYSSNIGATSTSTIITGDFGAMYVKPRNKEVMVPQALTGFKQISYREQESKWLSNNVSYFSNHTITRSNTDGNSLNFNVPALSEAQAFTTAFAQTVQSEAPIISYDFSNFRNFQLFNVWLGSSDNNQHYVNVEFFGSIKGSFPDDVLPNGYVSASAIDSLSSTMVDAELWGTALSLSDTQFKTQTLNQFSALPSQVSRPADMRVIGAWLWSD